MNNTSSATNRDIRPSCQFLTFAPKPKVLQEKYDLIREMYPDLRSEAYYRDVFDDSRAKWTHWQDSFNKDLGILADRIVAGSVVAYVGAGPSIASRKGRKQVPGWKALCDLLLDWANRDYPKLINDQVGAYLKRLIEKDNFPLFCQVLDNAYRENSDRLINQIVKSFSDAENLKPSEAYRAIAMLPIALRLTTNYEDLLERAIRDLGPAYKQLIPDTDSMSLTWADGPKVLDLVRSEKPGVVKIHGHIANGKAKHLVLTKNHYRELSANLAFWDILKSLLATRTFLFVGCSMSDPDIFALLDEVIEECHLIGGGDRLGEAAPLHFAFLGGKAWEPAFVRHLHDDYRIACLPVPDGADGRPDLVRLLRGLSGEIAERTQPTLSAFKPIFIESTATERLSEVIRCTGSERADIVFEDRGRDLKHWFNWDWHLPVRKGESMKSNWRLYTEPGLMSTAYLEPIRFQYAPRLPTPSSRERVSLEHGDQAPYYCWDEHSRSELAVPIMARGLRIGVLNIESYFSDAYTDAHRIHIERQAELLGAIRLEAEERDRRVREIKDLAYPGASGTAKFVESLRRFYPGGDSLEGVFYTPDFAFGKLTGYWKDAEKPVIHYPDLDLPPNSFANRVFAQREGCYEADFASALSAGRLNRDHARSVNLSQGPIFGCQVFDHELSCGVVVVWARQDGGAHTFNDCGLKAPGRRMMLATAANLVLAGRRCNQNTDDVAVSISNIFLALSDKEAFKHAADAVFTLGLRRVRLWKIEDKYAKIVYAAPQTYFDQVDGITETWIPPAKGLPTGTPVFNEYCRRIYTRRGTNPWARTQGPQSSGLGEDPQSAKLARAPGADWIIAPIVSGIGDCEETKLWGYLSSDPASSQEKNSSDLDLEDENQRNWMECGMSVIAVALAVALFELSPRRVSALGAGN